MHVVQRSDAAIANNIYVVTWAPNEFTTASIPI